MRCKFCGGSCKKIPKKEWGAGFYRCKDCGRSQVSDGFFELMDKMPAMDLSVDRTNKPRSCPR